MTAHRAVTRGPSVPVLARAAEAAPSVTLRCLPSDEHPDVLARFLTHGGRAIPIALVFDVVPRRDEEGLDRRDERDPPARPSCRSLARCARRRARVSR